jgi:hypothetical protein
MSPIGDDLPLAIPWISRRPSERMIKLFSKRASNLKILEMLMNVARDYPAIGAGVKQSWRYKLSTFGALPRT